MPRHFLPARGARAAGAGGLLLILSRVLPAWGQAGAGIGEPPVASSPEAVDPAPSLPAGAASGEVQPPELLRFVEAEYPPEALASRLGGSVELRLGIDATGKVTDAEVLSAPSAESGEAARAAALEFVFEPARRAGSARASRILYTYEFRLPEPLPLGAIEGVVRGAAGAPAAGARVTLRAADGSEWTAQTDARGQYQFEALAPGSYVLRVQAPGFGPARGLAPVVAGQTTRGELWLPAEPAAAGAAIEVTVQGRSAVDRKRESAEAVKVVETKHAQRESADLAEVLARTPGVGVRRSGGLGSDARFSLNGLTDDQIRFFVDGIPLDFTAYALGIANVPVNLVERVEIHSGVVPVRYGADALGGAVDLVTAGPRPGLRAAASYQLGSYGTHRATLSAQHLAESGFFSRVNAFFDAADNDYPVDVEVPNEVGRPVPVTVHRFHDAYRATGGSADLGWLGRPWARRLLLHGFFTDYDQDIQNNAVMTVPYGGVTYGETSAGGHLRYENSWLDAWRVDAVLGYAYTRGHYVDVDPCAYDWFGQCVVVRPRPGEREGQPHDRLTWQHALYGRANVTWAPAPGQQLLLSASPSFVTLMGDEQRQLDPTARDPLTADRELLTWVNGLEYRLQALGERLENVLFFKHYLQRARTEEPITSGVFVRRDRDTDRVGFGDGFRFRVAEPLVAKISYEWATRLPRTEEVFGNANLLLPNLDIEPEVSHNLNLGLLSSWPATAAGAFRAELFGFLREAEELIVLLSDDMFQIYQNVYSARSLGIEAALGWESPGAWLSIEANGTYQSFRNTSNEGAFSEFRGDRIPNRPWLFGNLMGRFTVRDTLRARDELSLAGYLRYVHEFFRGWESLGLRQYKQVVPGYLVPSAALTYLLTLDRARLSGTFEIDNLTDVDVQDYFGVQRPGRTFSAKIGVNY